MNKHQLNVDFLRRTTKLLLPLDGMAALAAALSTLADEYEQLIETSQFALDFLANTHEEKSDARFPETFCSQCGGEFGPGEHGYSHCEDHRKLAS